MAKTTISRILTSLELRTVVYELQHIITGSKVNKVYQPNSKTILFGIRKPGAQKLTLKIDSGVGVYIVQHDYKTQQIPPSFCMFLRKHLMNSTIEKISQRDLERVVEIKFNSKDGQRILICELFGTGNFILCDKDYIILNVAVNKVFKDRTIKRGIKYTYPPSRFNILNLTLRHLKSAVVSWKDYSLVKMLASGLSLGGVYAEEICLRAGVDKSQKVSVISEEDMTKIFNQTIELIAELDKSRVGYIYEQDGEPIDISPIDLEIYNTYSKKKVGTFSEAIDLLFAKSESERIKKERSAIFEKKLESLKKRLEIQKQSLESYKQEGQMNQRLADAIYGNYQLIANILDKISGARRMNFSWDDIKQVLAQEKAQGIYEASAVKQIVPEKNKIILDIVGGIELFVDKSIAKNASAYYEKAKSSKSKIIGAKRILEKTEMEIKKLEEDRSKIEKEIEKYVPKLVEITKKEWYEKFHWFFTSSGLLAIGGHDATQNDILIKKYMEITDLVFHTEMPGSPFFLLRDGRDKAKAVDKQEVAIATASYSRAWGQGRMSAEVYWVSPIQVTKKAEAGEYLSKGAFMIRGKKNFVKGTILEIAIGINKKDKLISGPSTTISKQSTAYVKIVPGSEKKSIIAKKILQHLNKTKIDDIMRVLPSGESTILSNF